MISISPSIQSNWDWRAAGNFVCGGSGTGLLAITAIAAWERPQLIQPAIAASLALVGLGLFLVWLEIGKTWRFANVFRNPATSWMSREAWTALALFACGGLAFLLVSPALTTLAALFGLVFLFCQARMLHASRGIPAWRDPSIQPLVFATGLSEGAGLLLAGTALVGTAPAWLPAGLLALVALRAVAMVVYTKRLLDRRAPLAVRRSLIEALAVVLVLGGLLPAVALAISPYGGAVAFAAAGLLAAAAGWTLKYAILRKLSFHQGFAIEHVPARGAPSSGIASHPGWSR